MLTMTEEFAVPVAKRQKLDQDPHLQTKGSRLFTPFRTIGLVSSTRVPFTSTPLGKTTFQITTSVGQSLHTYDLRRGLSLVFLSQPHCPQTITAMFAYRDRVFAAWGNEKTARGIWVTKRGKVVAELQVDNAVHQEIEQLIVFGPWVIGCGPRAVEVWRSETYDHYTTIRPRSMQPNSTAETRLLSGTFCTLPTFLNKIFVGRQDGGLDLYNVSTGKLVHSMPPPSQSSGKITALASSTALSVLAVAYADGTISLIDSQTDEILISLQQTNGRPVTSISFRSDGAGAGDDGRLEGVMATAGIGGGDISLWDLNHGGKLAGVLRGAHEVSGSSTLSGINKIEFMPGQPVIVSSGLDNALKSWIFDQTPFLPIPRPLHVRSGHAAPVSNVRFLPAASDGSEAAGKWLLSASKDRSLWGFSLRKDAQNVELSQGKIKAKAKKFGKLTDDSSTIEDLKAPPIIATACSLNRDGGMGAIDGPIWTNPKSTNAEEASMTGWESIVTAHENDSVARTWFWGRKRAGRWAFECGDRKPVTSVAITACGTFAIIGSAGGVLDMFNLQSGMHRQRFPPKLNPAQAKQFKIQQAQSENSIEVERGHQGGITGIVVDALNQTMVTTSLGGLVIFWDFATGKIIHKTTFDFANPTAIRYNSVSNLTSISCDDLCIRIIDIDTKKIVRELWGCAGQIYDHCFSHDGRWIVASSMDSVIRVFDLATGHLIDAFKTATCTSIAFSSTGEFLATSHAGSIGINVWNSKSLYSNVPSRQIDEDTGIIDLTMSTNFDAASQLAIQVESTMIEEEVKDMITQSTIEQLDEALLTLSLVPQSRWQTLLNLDIIRERNKPIAAPEKPKVAPFFLGSTNLTNSDPLLLAESSDKAPFANGIITTTTPNEQSHIARLTSLSNPTNTSTATTTTSISALLEAFALQESKTNANTDRNDKTRSQNQTMKPADPIPIIKHMTHLPPSQADLTIRTLSLSELPPFIHALTIRLQQRRDFELVNTWMAVLLRCHFEFVQVDQVRDALVEFKTVMDIEADRLASLVGWVRGVGDFLRSAR